MKTQQKRNEEKTQLEDKIKTTANITFNGKKAKCFSYKVKNKLMT